MLVTYVGTRGGGRAVPPGREGGAGGWRASPGLFGTAGAGRAAAGGAGGARPAAAAGTGPAGAPPIGRRLGPPGEGGDARDPPILNELKLDKDQ